MVVLLFTVLLACQPSTNSDEPVVQDFRFGTEGLFIQFAPGAPSPRLFDNQEFVALVEVQNRGTHTVDPNSGNIHLSGFDDKIIKLDDATPRDQQLPQLSGRGPFITQGGIDTITFTGRIDLRGFGVDKYATNVLATACYAYQTVATANFCVDPSPFSATRRTRVCTPAPISLGSQGAPVAVTSIDVEPTPDFTRLQIRVSNVGSGDVFKLGQGPVLGSSNDQNPQLLPRIDKCSPYQGGLRFDEVDYVKISEVKVSGIALDLAPGTSQACRPLLQDRENQGDYYLRLVNGQGVLYCEVKHAALGVQGDSTFVTPLSVVLDYGYRTSVSTPIEIRPTGR
ncbi:hypothetical protein COV18_03475 [Candidatus Woesearchaeota archaeon CG10_big_fil_rev_8_21_14_0_10_37_12]|nr:MAG: hypothetical protein COV18_03475 [Candidatus Woesearchaeota archaeon CG10_big_fil_rev_8_21_14_0_10_37_12]